MRLYVSSMIPVLILVLLCEGEARADVVGPPPKNCPAGYTRGDTCHAGPYCRLLPCVDNIKCSAGTTCQQHKLCIRKIDCSGRSPTPYWIDDVKGSCEGGALCSKGGTCTAVKICKAGTPDSGGPGADSGTGEVPSRGCSCQLGAGGPAALPWPLVGLALLLALRRRSP